jgi:hypothetical protein
MVGYAQSRKAQASSSALSPAIKGERGETLENSLIDIVNQSGQSDWRDYTVNSQKAESQETSAFTFKIDKHLSHSSLH